MEKYLIYLATNKINQKKYVGQTKSWRFQKRIDEHLHFIDEQDHTAFHLAIKKYGEENFDWTILENDIPEDLVDEREKYWISYYNTYIHAEHSCGYNETFGGQGTHGYIFTEADREKMSEKQINYWEDLKDNNPEEYERLCEIRRINKLGKKWTDESRQKLSQSCKGRTPWNKDKKGCQLAWNKGMTKWPMICKYELVSGKLVAKFNNFIDASESILDNSSDVRTRANRISQVCKANRGHAYNYIWRFECGKDVLDEQEVKQENIAPRSKAILQYDLNYNLIAEYVSAAAYSKTIYENFADQRRLARAINNACVIEPHIYNEYIWVYK